MSTQLIHPAEPAAADRAPPAVVRVLHLINGEHYAGAERVQDLLALRLADYGYEVGFACLKPDRFPEVRHAQQAPLWELPMRSRLDLKPLRRLVRLIRDENFDVLHTHTPRTVMLGCLAARAAGVPLVHHVHMQTSTEWERAWRGRANAWLERRCMKRAARIVAVSDSLADYLRKQGFRDDRIAVVPNGVESPAVGRDAVPPQAEWTLGMVALFRPRKGIETLFDAMRLLHDRGMPVRLRAVGRFEMESYEREVHRRAAELGLEPFINWVGFTPDVNLELARIDLLVLPSLLAEGLPMVVIEAMAAGVPVVGSRVDGITDCLRDGHDGLLATPGSPESLAATLAKAIRGEADWSTMRARALARHEDQFSDEAMARRMAEVYWDLGTAGPGDQGSLRPTADWNKSPCPPVPLSPGPKVRLFGMMIDPLSLSQAVARLRGWIASSDAGCRYVVTPNTDHVVLFQQSDPLRGAYATAAMVLADGAPVVLAARLLGKPLYERATGSDLVPALFDAHNDRERPLRVFLLGAAPGVAERAAANIVRRWPAVEPVGCYSPPVGFENDEAENERIIACVNAARPDVLVVGLGAPKQELWTARHQARLAVPVALCVGATIDFLADEKRRAPRWMQRCGLEWLHRCASEPRRLAKRYARDAWVFPRLVWREWRSNSAGGR